MADIFVSYSREDQWRVQPLVEALEQEGFSVWWDGEIDPGHQFDESIDQEIQQASCVVVAWSETSIGSRWVRNEALEGMDRGILVPVLLDNVRLPVAFKSDQTADFTDWPSSVDEGHYEHLIRALNVLTGREANARQSPRTLDALKVRGRRRYRRKRDWLVPSLALAVVALAAALVLLPDDVSEPTGVRLTVDRFGWVEDPVENPANDAGERAGAYAESLSYEIQRQLATVEGIDLVQVGSPWDFEVLPVLGSSLAREADFVLSGYVSSENGSLVVDASLQDTENGTTIWSDRFEAPADDVLKVQKQLLAAV